jgi:hypothetical protein
VIGQDDENDDEECSKEVEDGGGPKNGFYLK